MSAASITCPRCGMTSHNPTDAAEGYCGHCHDWTRPDTHLATDEHMRAWQAGEITHDGEEEQ